MFRFQNLLVLSTIGVVYGVPIIVKDFYPRHFTANYAIRPVSQLHTLAVPKTYLSDPKNYILPKIYVAHRLTQPKIAHTVSAHIPAVFKDSQESNDPNSLYSYSYSVADPSTGDNKNVEESKTADGVVRGSYSLVEPDGVTIRKVSYTADDINGFQAVVEKINQRSTFLKKPIVATTYLSPVATYKTSTIHTAPGSVSRHYFH